MYEYEIEEIIFLFQHGAKHLRRHLRLVPPFV
jgi:hypothetical protein